MGAKITEGINEYFLYEMMCMVGLPVEVQVRDGSVYSGIFHTASFAEDHGIVLKKARKIRKEKHDNSFTVGSTIDTLVVFSFDFVQVVVKDFMLPATGISADIDDDRAVAGTVEFVSHDLHLETESEQLISTDASSSWMLFYDKENCSLDKKDMKFDLGLDGQKMLDNPPDQEHGSVREDTQKGAELSPTPMILVQESQVTGDIQQREASSHGHVDMIVEANNIVHENHYSSQSTSSEASNGTRCGSSASSSVKADESIDATLTSYPSSDSQALTTSTCSTEVGDARASSCPTLLTSRNSNIKQFKLNPEAKIYSPTLSNSRQLSVAVPTAASTVYIPNIPPLVTVPAAQSRVEINSLPSHSSLNAKLTQCDGLVTGYSGVPAQYARPVIGHYSALQPPVRLSGQYHPVQAAPAYVQPPPQTVMQLMLGRMGQLVYVHPVPQDAIQGGTVHSQGLPYPLLNHCQPTMPKIQGAVISVLTALCGSSVPRKRDPPSFPDSGGACAFPSAFTCHQALSCSRRKWLHHEQVPVKLKNHYIFNLIRIGFRGFGSFPLINI